MEGSSKSLGTAINLQGSAAKTEQAAFVTTWGLRYFCVIEISPREGSFEQQLQAKKKKKKKKSELLSV